MVSFSRAVAAVTSLALGFAGAASAAQPRQTARQLGVVVGVLPPGPLNAITDVSGVLVGQVTIRSGDSINTGVTVVLPHDGNLFRDKVPGAVVVGNGFGKLMGFTQVQALGELEAPIVLTCTLRVPRAADATLTYLLSLLGNESVRSINVVVGETNDGTLNNIRARPLTERDVLRAIEEGPPGPWGRLDGGSAGADHLRRDPADRGRAGGHRTGPLLSAGRVGADTGPRLPRRLRDDRAGDRRAPWAAEPDAVGAAGARGGGAPRPLPAQTLRRL